MSDDELIAGVISLHRKRGWRLDYPPATESQVEAAEQAIGFLLPPLLCRLYREVGNGGFGPCRAFLGLSGGYADEDIGKALTLADVYAVCHDPKEALLPDGLVPVRNWGCARRSCLDCTAPEVPVQLFVGVERRLVPDAPSLAEWLARWLVDPDNFWR